MSAPRPLRYDAPRLVTPPAAPARPLWRRLIVILCAIVAAPFIAAFVLASLFEGKR